MREVQASCSSDLELGQAGRAIEGGGKSLPIVPVVSLLNGMGAAATVNIYLGILTKIHCSLRTPHLLEFRTNCLLTARSRKYACSLHC